MREGLPPGWAQITLADLGSWGTGGTPSRREPSYFGSGYPWVKSGDLPDGPITSTEEQITEAGLRNSSAKLLPAGTLSMALYGATIGKLGIFQFEAATNQACANVLPNRNLVETKYLFYYLLAERDAFINLGQGGAQPNISQGIVREHPFPLAPLAEQRRIVAKLEALLAKVNASRKRLERIPVILKRFRQAVLAAACDGRLTEDWRRSECRLESATDLLKESLEERRRIWTKNRTNRGLSASEGHYKYPVAPSDEFEFEMPESWVKCSVDQLSTAITSGSRDWKQYYREDGVGTFVMAQNVRPLVFDRTYRLAVAPPEGNPDRSRSEIKFGDLLVTIVGANTGDVCRVDADIYEHYVCQSVALIRPVFCSTSEYLNLFLNSPAHGRAEYLKWSYGEGRPHLSFDHLRKTAISLPPANEQQEIVRRVADLFALADQIEARYAKAKAQVDRLSQSILAKAFRGELVPQDPNDEPADVLLSRLTAAPAEASAPARRRGRPPRVQPAAPPVAPAAPAEDSEAPALADLTPEAILQAHREVLASIPSPLSEDNLLRAVAQRLGFQRLGCRIKTVLKTTISQEVAQETVEARR